VVDLLAEYGLDTPVGGLRRNAIACVALPTCGLALAESERYLPSLITRLDALLADGTASANQDQRRRDYAEAQQILARDLPAINLWYRDTVVVHNRRLTHVVPTPSGDFTFLETAELAE